MTAGDQCAGAAGTGRPDAGDAGRDERTRCRPAWQDLLTCLRRIIRATDTQSKRIEKLCGMTLPQLMVLRAIEDLGDVTVGRLSREVSLSQATVTTILNRLEDRELIRRARSVADKRVVNARLTAAGEETLANAPLLLHERFIERFESLAGDDQAAVLASLESLAAMMDAAGPDEDPALLETDRLL